MKETKGGSEYDDPWRFRKFNDDVKQHVQSAETDHEERVIQADERIIEVENKKEMAHEAKLVENEALDEESGLKKLEDKIENAEIKHEEKVIARKEDNMAKEDEKFWNMKMNSMPSRIRSIRSMKKKANNSDYLLVESIDWTEWFENQSTNWILNPSCMIKNSGKVESAFLLFFSWFFVVDFFSMSERRILTGNENIGFCLEL